MMSSHSTMCFCILIDSRGKNKWLLHACLVWFNGISQGNSFEIFPLDWCMGTKNAWRKCSLIGLRGALAGPNGQGRPPIRLDVKSTGSGFTCGWQLIDHLMPNWWVVQSVKLSGYPKPDMALRSLWLGYGKKFWSLHFPQCCSGKNKWFSRNREV